MKTWEGAQDRYHAAVQALCRAVDSGWNSGVADGNPDLLIRTRIRVLLRHHGAVLSAISR